MQTIAIEAASLSCCLAYGLVAMGVGVACVAFATAEAQEVLGYGNWMKDSGMSDGWYSGLMMAANVAAIAINIVGVKQCFKEGTLVACLSEEGIETHKPIEDVKVGDRVLAYNEETGEQAYKPVKQLFRNTTEKWCTASVLVGSVITEIVSTPGHKYYLPENTVCREVNEVQEHESYYGLSEKWVSAQNLRKGDKVLLSDGKYGIIVSVKIEELETPETTYNFEVEDYHTYYVGEESVCVHNAGCGGFDSRTVAGPEDVGKYKDVRIDVEVGGSGKTNIHMQAKGLDKMYFDSNSQSFPSAPKKLRESQFVQKGIKKALNLIERRG